MGYQLAEAPRVINTIIGPPHPLVPPVFATSNKRKLEEFARLMRLPIEKVLGVDLGVEEIQDYDPFKVAEHKAKEAWLKNGGKPIIIEETSLDLLGLPFKVPGPFIKYFADSPELKQMLCDQAFKTGDQRAVARVILAVYDGEQVQMRIGEVSGKIPARARGGRGFGWDDIFIPDGQKKKNNRVKEKTFGEMSGKEKDRFSMRRIALEAMLDDPFKINKKVFALPPPYEIQLKRIRKERLLNGNKRALKHGFALETLKGVKPNKKLEVKEKDLPPYREVDLGDGVYRYIVDPDSSSLGLIITPWDVATDQRGKPKRLKLDSDGSPIFWQRDGKTAERAIAARMAEFNRFHNPEMYKHIRDLKKGKIKITPRSQTRAPIVEKLIEMQHDGTVDMTVALKQLGYARQSSSNEMSRKKNNPKALLLVDPKGLPTSLFALGGMPPVTGWKDVIVTAALSFCKSYIPRNSIFAGDLNRQIDLFNSAVEDIRSLKLPKDIEEIVIGQIGISVGIEDPKDMAKIAKKIKQAGCKSIRIYTTNPDPRTVEMAKAIRKACGDKIHICVGPVVDFNQAEDLLDYVDTFLAGHGGGENCNSLRGGGAANSLELLYQMYKDPRFKDKFIGLEGGTGETIGGLLGMLDVISLNRRGVLAGIECGGLCVEHVNDSIVQPYHGSASPLTQWEEANQNEDLADRRVDDAGDLFAVEGKPNYMRAPGSAPSMVIALKDERTLAVSALADQDARSISELRANIEDHGFKHRKIADDARVIAEPHRGNR